MSKPKQVVPEKVIGYEFAPSVDRFQNLHSILYALGIGFSQDPMNEKDLQFTYELHEDFKPFPTQAVVLSKVNLFDMLVKCPGLPEFNPMSLLHGEQKINLVRPLKADTDYISKAKFTDIADKGKGAVLEVTTTVYEVDQNKKEHLAFSSVSNLFIRGIGGFGFKGSKKPEPQTKVPTGNPTKSVELQTVPNQAIIYRLSGDYNPLHIDPNMAAMGGFDRPILHGLCFYGMAARAVVQNLLNNDSSRIQSLSARFVGSVFPGESITYDLFQEGNNVTFVGKVKGKNTQCIVGELKLKEQPKL